MILADDLVMRTLVRLLFTDQDRDAAALKTLRFTSGALRSLVLDARGKDYILDGGPDKAGSAVLNRLTHLQVRRLCVCVCVCVCCLCTLCEATLTCVRGVQNTCRDASTAKYVSALLKRIRS